MISLPDEAHGALAVGWATVELERAARELSHLLVPGSAFTDAPSSAILGARCRVGPAGEHTGLRIVLLEPETEGRLAATLARRGEGWSAMWEASGVVSEPPGPVTAPPRPAVSARRPGPLGRERLVPGAGPAAPHRLLVDVPSQT
ncbi:MAG: hypothetical protein H0W22_02285 [Chloroflexi bacterium]|nr:hypothetical protein [Chloroflexota bacterium]